MKELLITLLTLGGIAIGVIYYDSFMGGKSDEAPAASPELK